MAGIGSYYFHISANNCVDAQHTLWSLGRYANDAAGFGRLEKLRNNSIYKVIKRKPYIIATRNLKPDMEIFVSYGKEYWDVMKEEMMKKKTKKQI